MGELCARDMKRARDDVGEEAGAYGAVAHAGIDAVMRKRLVDALEVSSPQTGLRQMRNPVSFFFPRILEKMP